MDDREAVAAMRSFNRFYTRQLGLLSEHVHASPHSLSEARLLFELSQRADPTAAEVARDLGMDEGQVSRTLKRLVELGLVERRKAPDDMRRALLGLTPAGRARFAELDAASSRETSARLAILGVGDRRRLIDAMHTIERLLSPPTERPALVLRGLEIGDLGWIARRQGMLYAEEYGWDHTFEALVAEILIAFVRNFDARRERAWIAEQEGQIVGSIFCVQQSTEIAKLRLLYVEPSTRGSGIGRRLVDECIRFARAKGYRTLTLWTNDILVAARHIYVAAGFELVAEERHHSFGVDLVGQNWDLVL